MKTIYDPIHGYMKFNKILLKIIDTIEFKRLKNIKQLGFVHHVFPWATHTRFEHSLGTCFLASKIINKINEKHPELNLSKKDILLIEISALIHDLGHGPYWHFYDVFLKEKKIDWKHEIRWIKILQHIIDKYKINEINENDIKIISDIVLWTKKGFYYQIVSNKKNNLDCDKFDYICRDAYYLGMPYSIDYIRLIDDITIINNDIFYPIKFKQYIYEIYNTRFKLFNNVYTHRVVQQIELMMLDVFFLLDKYINLSDVNDIDNFININDETIFNMIYKLQINNEDIIITKAKKILENILSRKLYKFIIELNYDQNTYNIMMKKFKNKNIIFKSFKINYCNKQNNPLLKINFFDIPVDNDKYFDDLIYPINFQNNILRIFFRDN